MLGKIKNFKSLNELVEYISLEEFLGFVKLCDICNYKYMKKKSKQVTEFIEKLNYHITSNPQFRKDTSRKSEQFIQAEIRPLIISFLEIHFVL